MKWLVIEPQMEVSECSRFTIRWRPAGFGIWVAEAWCGETKLEEWASGDREDAGKKARETCQRHAWGWLPT